MSGWCRNSSARVASACSSRLMSGVADRQIRTASIAGRYVAVQALDSAGAVIGVSAMVSR